MADLGEGLVGPASHSPPLPPPSRPILFGVKKKKSQKKEKPAEGKEDKTAPPFPPPPPLLAQGLDQPLVLVSSRACHKLLEISQKVAQNFSERCSKVAFCNESCSIVVETTKNSFWFLSSIIWSDAKICNLICTKKLTFVSFLRFN